MSGERPINDILVFIAATFITQKLYIEGQR